MDEEIDELCARLGEALAKDGSGVGLLVLELLVTAAEKDAATTADLMHDAVSSWWNEADASAQSG